MKTLLSWSTGKDSAWALHLLRQNPDIELAGLLTTTNWAHRRVAMHGVREELLYAQGKAVNLPVWKVELPDACSDEMYEEAMGSVLKWAKSVKVEAVAFGDLFLEDIRAYREKQMEPTGIKPIFPLWGMPTDRLAREMIEGGLQARLTCVDPKKLDRSFAGRAFDKELLESLPAGVDPCGERGEFHTFAWSGPMFDAPVEIKLGEVVERGGFVFADLLRAGEP
jgi:uncharacterized protein (TIGR00290 family)